MNNNNEVNDYDFDDDVLCDVSDNDEDENNDDTTGEETTVHGRDEVKEVRKMSSKDTFRLRLWRVVVTGVILLTALAVTITTFTLLKRQEEENFNTAFTQFARTVGDAAVDQQRRLRQSLIAFTHHISSSAQQANATFPIFRIPDFELHAADVRRQSGAEIVSFTTLLESKDADEYLDFVTANYEDSAKEGHLTRYGNLDRLIPIGYTPNFTTYNGTAFQVDTVDRELRAPQWQISPPTTVYFTINWDFLSGEGPLIDAARAMFVLQNESVVTITMPFLNSEILSKEEHDAMHSVTRNSDISFPHSFISTPVHSNPKDDQSKLVGWVTGGISWDFALRFLLPSNVDGIMVEIRNSCNQTSLYELAGHDAFFLGDNATHQKSEYRHMEVVRDLSFSTHPNFTTTSGHCRYNIHIFPSEKFHDAYQSSTPNIFASVVAFTFVLVAVVFIIYDILVQSRNEKIVDAAARSSAIVSSMFPDAIRDRLMQQHQSHSKQTGLKSYLLTGEGDNNGNMLSKPLADLFLETTVMFADICGFTAWSSVRDPTQVFVLLETLYKAFDAIANRRRVFKVETVGDCYVAVTGLPEPVKDHAVVMARFAREILVKTTRLTKMLEVTLGPGTGELQLRIGMHSGPVTGGVLRGERSRFQLFGDTMNTTARIESTGERGCIHLSSETAGLLKQAGKQSWLKKRETCVTAKGKGSMQTYWLTVVDNRDDHTISAESDGKYSLSSGLEELDYIETVDNDGKLLPVSQQTTRLIKWNVEQLLGLMKQVVARRLLSKSPSQPVSSKSLSGVTIGKSPIDEVQEIIILPEFDAATSNEIIGDANDVVIPPIVVAQLKAYVTWVASMYKNNPFHNFDHASHVVMSVIKLMSRIVAPSDHHINDNAATLHDHTYGITSDPLTQFACAFSALIHDVDHTGVPNTTLVLEEGSIATKYSNRSVAEQNSLDLAWDSLMNGPQYSDLRAILFLNQSELIRFRKLVVNGVMATDIADKDLKTLRNNRWDKAFKVDVNHSSLSKTDQRDAVNRKATIVIEHLIQASDVSHTMQHWHVFRKWNQSLFEEMYDAYINGRAETNPADFWYKGEIGFFDYYIIPLAKKLKDCGVFGVSSDEYLNYAMKNCEEWEARGHEIVAEMVELVTNVKVAKKQNVIVTGVSDSELIEC